MSQRTVDLDQARSDTSLPALEAICPIFVGQVLRDRYELKERLGTGGRGAVFKAHDRFRTSLPEAQQYVALKVLSVGASYSEETLANLRLEFYCGQVLSHRNVVNVYELDRDEDVIFFTMELLDGEPLSTVLERLRPAAMRRSQAWQLIQQLGAGLAHAHERGVVHGDLKPQNILITREGELRILDFGAAHRSRALNSQSEHPEYAPTSGTPAYASCEQLEGRPADPRDDLYALACICYELLAGSHPFDSRPATLARDYRVSVARPHGLTARQWRTLQRGLSWHRAGRSISVHSWMHRLMNDREAERSVTPLQELTQAEAVQTRTPWRAAALLLVGATLIAATALMQPRSLSALKTAASPAFAVAENGQVGTADEPAAKEGAPNEAEPTGAAASGVGPNGVGANGAAPTKLAGAQANGSDKKEGDGASQPNKAGKASSLVISVEPSQVRSDDHFAEIRLHRSSLQKVSSFTWWTEPATAKPDVDYVPEAVAIQTFPAGYRATRLYVRLLPQPLRSHRAYFYIAVAQPGHQGRSTVIRRQVWLPMSSSLEAQR